MIWILIGVYALGVFSLAVALMVSLNNRRRTDKDDVFLATLASMFWPVIIPVMLFGIIIDRTAKSIAKRSEESQKGDKP
jgi:hypothetical protein